MVSFGAVLVASSRLGAAAVLEEVNQRLLEGFIYLKVLLEEYQDRLSGFDASFIALHECRQLVGDRWVPLFVAPLRRKDISG